MPSRLPATILDTGILISGLGNAKGLPAKVLASVIGERSAIVSFELVAEYLSSLTGARARRHHSLTVEQAEQFVRSFQRVATNISADSGPMCPDKRDQHLWDLLQTVPGCMLVTGEDALLRSDHFPGRVLSPRQFVEHYLKD